MNSTPDSLYTRLALVLLVALLAGFGTMYSLFRSHSEDVRVANAARNVSVQVRLVEQLLAAEPEFASRPIPDVQLAGDPPSIAPTGELRDFLEKLRVALSLELDREIVIRNGNLPQGGYWVNLSTPAGAGPWLHLPHPLRRRTHVEPWTWGLWVSFGVVLVGGMALLWGVSRPLRRLEKAIAKVGQDDAEPVSTRGPREIRNLAEQYNRMVERLRQYDRDRAEMLAGVAHDLRAPITRLRLQLELEESARHEAMVGNLDGIEAIIGQFLTFARGADCEAAQPLNLAAFVDDLLLEYRQRGVVAGQVVPCTVAAMPTALQRALTNLIENALEYGAGPITVGVAQQQGWAVIGVCDAGPGIPAEKLGYAAQAFTRLDTARPGKGHCGLGLAITAHLAAQHGGRLQLRKAEPHGLIAEIHLPIEDRP